MIDPAIPPTTSCPFFFSPAPVDQELAASVVLKSSYHQHLKTLPRHGSCGQNHHQKKRYLQTSSPPLPICVSLRECPRVASFCTTGRKWGFWATRQALLFAARGTTILPQPLGCTMMQRENIERHHALSFNMQRVGSAVVYGFVAPSPIALPIIVRHGCLITIIAITRHCRRT